MKLPLALLPAVFASMLVLPVRALSQPLELDVPEIAADDPAMMAAVKEARRTLPQFRALYDRRPQEVETYFVKVGVPVPSGGTEVVWMGGNRIDDLVWGGGIVTGEIATEPKRLNGVQRVTVKQDDIADWSYSKGGRTYGMFTLRLELSRLHVAAGNPREKELVEGLKTFLSSSPLEPDWR